MEKVLINPLAGVLSAYGMGLADIRALRERTVELPLEAGITGGLAEALDALEGEARAEVSDQGIDRDAVRVERRVHVRYAGTDTALDVPFASRARISQAFEEAHRRRFGFAMPGHAMVCEAVSVEAMGSTGRVKPPERNEMLGAVRLRPLEVVPMVADGVIFDTPIFSLDGLAPGESVEGPCLIVEANATTVVEPGWKADLTGHGDLLLTRARPRDNLGRVSTKADPVLLEIFNNLFMSIAEQMGATLANTAYSVNIKERLPHVPVHLGSMGESVKTVLREQGDGLRPGDTYILNAPYNGGTHLPDVTAITPVFDGCGEELLFFVASRGHHADIGGVTPGSMPPDSTSVEEEGVLIDTFRTAASARRRCAKCWAPVPGRPAIPTRTWPTSRPRWPPTKKACANSAPWSTISASAR